MRTRRLRIVWGQTKKVGTLLKRGLHTLKRQTSTRTRRKYFLDIGMLLAKQQINKAALRGYIAKNQFLSTSNKVFFKPKRLYSEISI